MRNWDGKPAAVKKFGVVKGYIIHSGRDLSSYFHLFLILNIKDDSKLEEQISRRDGVQLDDSE